MSALKYSIGTTPHTQDFGTDVVVRFTFDAEEEAKTFALKFMNMMDRIIEQHNSKTLNEKGVGK